MADQRGLVRADLVDLLTRAQRALARDLGTVLEEEGVTVDQWRVLRELSTGGRTMGDLAMAVEIPHPTLTRLVDALVDSAFLYRSQSPTDRRKVAVHVSDPGRAKLDRLEALAAAHEQALSTRLGTDTVTHLATLLRTLP
ncbi:MarR family winged helix-turn-helix transcriptional regulator [Saccharothrix violaceirubra]|uniref:DNA-binding MarR family transcriptional regulator n=1 Tax=Saccharothrix violaceirubra TaxID=413306 RepID=A0A7W7T5K6_9PSEU|nr:MarR family transcriptional regulator [Saccharothrix violaceirubra]MBB4966970.1 DNA-binding MarR family transcriptional regulator [Saccharothrix violaceirubra]